MKKEKQEQEQEGQEQKELNNNNNNNNNKKKKKMNKKFKKERECECNKPLLVISGLHLNEITCLVWNHAALSWTPTPTEATAQWYQFSAAAWPVPPALRDPAAPPLTR